jgi:hypothetical protein
VKITIGLRRFGEEIVGKEECWREVMIGSALLKRVQALAMCIQRLALHGVC